MRIDNMRSDIKSRVVTASRGLFSMLLATGLALAVGAHNAAADDDPPKAPRLVSVEAESPTALHVKWTGVEKGIDGINVLLYGTGDQTDAPPMAQPLTALDGGSMSTSGEYSFKGLEPDTGYCVAVEAFVSTGIQGNNLFSNESYRLCVSTTGLPITAPNLVVREIRGKEDLDWDVPGERNPVYILMLQNDGADAGGSVVVEIQTSGVVTLADQLPILQQGWASQGFSCTRGAASGGANASMLCTGGSLKTGQSFDPGVLTRVTGRGFGSVHMAINVTRGRGDSDFEDNRLTLSVQVT